MLTKKTTNIHLFDLPEIECLYKCSMIDFIMSAILDLLNIERNQIFKTVALNEVTNKIRHEYDKVLLYVIK